MVRSGKPRTAYFCDSFSLKNRSMGKKQGPVRTAVGPHGFENREWFSWFSRFLFFFSSKYQLKLKIWSACTLDFFQIWNQKICEGKKILIEKKKMTKQGLCEVEAASQQPSTDRQSRPSSSSSASISSSFFFFSFFPFFFPSPLLWFLSFSHFSLFYFLLQRERLRVAVEHRRSSFGFGAFRDWIGLKDKRKKLKCKLVGLGEIFRWECNY